MRDLVLGIDLGTSACKAVVADSNARVLSIGTADYAVHAPLAGWAEQDAEEVWHGMLTAVRKALRSQAVTVERVGAVSFSAAMHGLMPVDQAGHPLMRCIIWADRRSQPQAERMRCSIDPHEAYLRTGCPLQPLFWPSKLLWLQEWRPEIVRSAHRYVAIKDLILQRLIGRCVMDVSSASATGLLNTHSLAWDEGLLQRVRLTPRQLPDLVLPETVLGTLDQRWADDLGLPGDVTVVAGGGDGGLANVGAGAVGAGHVATSIGTSGAVRVVLPQPCFDAQERTWCYVVTNDMWLVGGAINNGGVVYHWLRDQLCPAEVEDAKRLGRDFGELLDEYAAEIPAGAEGLVFLPLLLGERSPGWKANARAILFGLSMQHTRKHIIRAAVEGVAFRLYSILQVLQGMPGGVRDIRATGGLAHSRLWMSILADVYGQPVSIPQVRESSALGAVFLALKALGCLRGYADVRQFVAIEHVQEPSAANHRLYSHLYELFQDLYQEALHHYDELEHLSNQSPGF